MNRQDPTGSGMPGAPWLGGCSKGAAGCRVQGNATTHNENPRRQFAAAEASKGVGGGGQTVVPGAEGGLAGNEAMIRDWGGMAEACGVLSGEVADREARMEVTSRGSDLPGALFRSSLWYGTLPGSDSSHWTAQLRHPKNGKTPLQVRWAPISTHCP